MVGDTGLRHVCKIMDTVFVTRRYDKYRNATVRHVTLCYASLRFITLHYASLRFVTLRYALLAFLYRLCYASTRFDTLRYASSRCVPLRYATVRHVTLRYATVRYGTLVTLRYAHVTQSMILQDCVESQVAYSPSHYFHRLTIRNTSTLSLLSSSSYDHSWQHNGSRHRSRSSTRRIRQY